MDREMKARIEEAKRYQKLAFRALLPDSMAGHMDVIEKEIRAMTKPKKDKVTDIMGGATKTELQKDTCGGRGPRGSAGTGKNVKKITIS